MHQFCTSNPSIEIAIAKGHFVMFRFKSGGNYNTVRGLLRAFSLKKKKKNRYVAIYECRKLRNGGKLRENKKTSFFFVSLNVQNT